MENSIKEYCEERFIAYGPIPDNSVERIYNLFIKDTFTEPLTDIEMLYYGRYYQKQGDDKNMMKYYLMAIEAGNSEAMIGLGLYYEIKEDYGNMKKYYLMAIEMGNSFAMYCLGWYYIYVEKDYEKMLKYNLMAIEVGNNDAIHNLVSYYMGYNDYNGLIDFYIKIKDYNKFQETLEDMHKNNRPYNEQTIQHIINYGYHFTDDCNFLLKQYYNSLKQKIDLMELHFKYTDNGLGMKEAKDDFILQLTVKN